jgi:hypothetical protein
MRRLLIIPVLATLSGCADSVYYDARYQPTDVDSTYSVEERIFWTGDAQNYALPAAPPDLADDAPARKDCAYPYQKMKGVQIAGHGPFEVAGHPDNHPFPISKMDDRLHPTGPDTALAEPERFGVIDSPAKPGIPPDLNNPVIGMTNDHPRSRTGAGTDVIAPMPYVGWNKPSNPYCCGDNYYRHAALPTPAAPRAPAPAAAAVPAADPAK